MSAKIHLPSAQREIGGKTYKIYALPAMPGRKTLVRLVKVMGPTMAAGLRGLSPAEQAKILSEGAAMTSGGTAEAIREFCANLTEADLEYLYATFEEHTEVEAENGMVPLSSLRFGAFAADYGSMLGWLAFCIEHNYASFLGGLNLTGRRG